MDLRRITQSLLLRTGNGVKVAVLDSGIHPELPLLKSRNNKVFGCELTPKGLEVTELPAGEVSDRNGHGSCVQSCIVSVAPEVEIHHYRILDKFNNCPSALLCYVLDHALEKDYQVINLSLGTRNEEHVPWLVSSMKRAYEQNISIVAASSNVGNVLYPGRFTYAISCEAILATNPMHIRFRKNSVVEFAAWGIQVPIPGVNGLPFQVTGSSFAAAHITGLVARIIELMGTSSPLDAKVLLREYAKNIEESGSRTALFSA
jgi:subtilisin family serine protease